MNQSEIATLIRTLSTGIYGVGVSHAGVQRIFTASWLMPVSFDPVLIALSVNPENRSYGLMIQSGRFSVNVIDELHADLTERMAAPGNRLETIAWKPGIGDCPLLDDALAQLQCRIVSQHPAGDHHLMIAEVIGGQIMRSEATPLLYGDTGNVDGALSLFPQSLSEDPSPTHE
jgi:flavin reductase (DIM6/NTAB) family NADH-FMN oxidoreductase RutF